MVYENIQWKVKRKRKSRDEVDNMLNFKATHSIKINSMICVRSTNELLKFINSEKSLNVQFREYLSKRVVQ